MAISETGANGAAVATGGEQINPGGVDRSPGRPGARRVGEQKVRDHMAAGLPTGPGQTFNLVHYAAWLNRRLKERDGD